MKIPHLSPLSFLVLGLLCGCQSTSKPAPTSVSAHAVPDSLTSLNQLFLDGYRERQAIVKSNTRPLIVADFNVLILYWNGVTETNRCIPEIYNALKDVAHVPFGIYLRLTGCTAEPCGRIPAPALEELRAYPAKIAAAENSLSEAGFTESQLARQKAILGECGLYLSNVLSNGTAPSQELLAFARRTAPWLLQNADEAAAAQLDMTHAVVMQWKHRIPADDWKRLVVVVRGPQMPRRYNLLTQYFAKVLDEPEHHQGYPLESRRLIYAEYIFSNRDHLDLMATTFVDGDASEAFFRDHWRMSRDLLADGAAKYLKRLKFE
jgi:hypothetical protein